MSQLCLSEKDEDSCSIKLPPNLGEGDRFISEDGEKEDLLKHSEDQEIEEHTKDVKEVIREERHGLEGIKRGKRNQKKSSMTRSVKGYAQFHADREKSLDNSSYVRYLTERDIFMQDQENVRRNNLEKYGHIIDENIVRLTQEYVNAVERGEKNNLKKFQPMECAIIGLTKGPANMEELQKRLNTAIENHIPEEKFRFGGKQLEQIIRRIVDAKLDSQWLRKFLQTVETNGSVLSTRYQFPPQLMKLAAEDPHKLWIGLSAKIPKIDQPFEEKEFLALFPELNKIPKLEEEPSSKKFDDIDEKEFNTRAHYCESDRMKIKKEIIESWLTITDIVKWELLLGIMQINPCITTPKKWCDKMLEFMKINKTKGANFGIVTSTDVSTIFRQKLSNPDLPIHRLMIIREKTSITKEFGLIPDAVKIPWYQLRELIPNNSDAWKRLEAYCLKYPEINSYVKSRELIPEKPEEKGKPEEKETEETLTQSKSSSYKSLMEIFRLVANGVSDEQLGKLVRENLPKLISILDFNVTINIGVKK